MLSKEKLAVIENGGQNHVANQISAPSAGVGDVQAFDFEGIEVETNDLNSGSHVRSNTILYAGTGLAGALTGLATTDIYFNVGIVRGGC